MRTHARWNYNSGSDSVAYWTVNAFLNSAGNAIYKATAAASQYTQIGGAHVWERAVSGTAGNTVTWLESARIDSTGNVGIGTASPVGRTDIAGTSVDQLAWGLLSVRSSDAQGADKGGSLSFGGLYDATNSTHWAQISGRKENGTSGQYGGYLAFATRTNGAGANTERARIDSSGNVGIGTASPLSRLNVAGTTGLTWGGPGDSSALVTIGTQGTAGGSLFVNTASLNSSFASGLAIDGTYSSFSSVVNIKALGVKSGGGYGSSIAFHTSSNTALNEQMRLDSSGYLGIGTASPGAILHTLGTGTTTGIFATSSANAWMELRRSTSTTLGYIGTGSGLVTGGAAADLAFRCESGNLLFSTVAAERARIDSSGRLGIGLSPSAFILETATDASIYGVRVGRGAGAQATNTVVGNAALNANTTGTSNTAVGNFAANAVTTGAGNTSIGFQANALLQGGSRNTAVGESAGYAALSSTDNTAIGRYAAVYNTGSNNVAVGSAALNGVSGSSSGGSNVAIGANALSVLTLGAGNTSLGVSSGSNITTGSNNILLGANAITVTATASNQLVIGSSGNYVATNGGATTWYTTATAQSSGVLPATCGFIRVLLNGTYVKIPVYAD